jgi:hypothetical protein
VACYAGNGRVLRSLGVSSPNYHYKVCELAAAALPPTFSNLSVVIMDGPFPSFDPLPGTGVHLLGHVDAMHHCENIGTEPEIPHWLGDLMDGKWHAPAPYSVFENVIAATARFLPGIQSASHIGSMFTVRALLPHVSVTDDRPTVVSATGNVISVFSGKLMTCVTAAKEVEAQLS